jgi:signal transduction histidine kinase
MIKKLGLGSRVAFTFFCLTAFIIAINIYINYRTSQDYFRDEIIGNLYTLAVAKKNHLNELFRSLEFETDEISKEVNISSQVEKLIILNKPDENQLKSIQKALLESETNNLDNRLGINILSLGGKVIASSDFQEIGKDESKEKFFRDFENMQTDSPYIKDDYSSLHFGKNMKMIAIINQILNLKQEKIGYLVSYYNINILRTVVFNFTNSNDYGKNVNFYLVNAAKILIARSGFVNNSSLGQTVGTLPTLRCFSNLETTGYYEDFQNRLVDGAAVCMNNGWTLIVEADEQAALKGFESIKTNIFRAGLVILVVLIITLFYVKHFVEKILDDFLSIAAHELRTPLGGMKWRIELLIKKNPGDGELQKDLMHLADSNRRSIEVVNDLLGVSKITRKTLLSDPKQVNLKSVINDVIKELTQEMEIKKVTIYLSCPEDLIVLVDAQQFQQVIENLLSNAVKYGKENGHIQISVEKSKPKFVRIIITDDGIGIRAADQKKIFNKFFRAENAVFIAGEGTGLGLFVAKTFIEKAGGKIWFASVEGQGTTFYIEVPCL